MHTWHRSMKLRDRRGTTGQAVDLALCRQFTILLGSLHVPFHCGITKKEIAVWPQCGCLRPLGCCSIDGLLEASSAANLKAICPEAAQTCFDLVFRKPAPAFLIYNAGKDRRQGKDRACRRACARG